MSVRAHPFEIKHKEISASFNLSEIDSKFLDLLINLCGYVSSEGEVGYFTIGQFELDRIAEAITEGSLELTESTKEIINQIKRDIVKYDTVFKDAVHYVVY